MARCRRRDFWRFDRHLHRDLAMVGHVSLHWFRSDNGAVAAMFRGTAVNARTEPVDSKYRKFSRVYFTSPFNAARMRVPFGLPSPVHASQPTPARYAPLSPSLTSRRTPEANSCTGSD
jgi:hypothetical protein